MATAKIVSYKPNPRVLKSAVVAKLNGATLDVQGWPMGEGKKWLWDISPSALAEGDVPETGYKKTDAFTKVNPFGEVPVCFNAAGTEAIFESNSIARYVCRIGDQSKNLYGTDAFSASQIDAWLDKGAALESAAQPLVGRKFGYEVPDVIFAKAGESTNSWMAKANAYLTGRDFLVGTSLTLADICVTISAGMILDVGVAPEDKAKYPELGRYVTKHLKTDAFSDVVALQQVMAARLAAKK